MKWYQKLAAFIERKGGKRTIVRPDFEGQASLYMNRFYIFKSPFCEIMLHQFFMSDRGDLHDHPWDSCGIILAGGYFEHVGIKSKHTGKVTHSVKMWRGPGYFGSRKADDFHKVELPNECIGKTWTLFITGKRNKQWGFLTSKGYLNFMDMFKLDGTANLQENNAQFSNGLFPRKVL